MVSWGKKREEASSRAGVITAGRREAVWDGGKEIWRGGGSGEGRWVGARRRV